MILTIIGFIVLGIVAGLLGRLIVPGPDPMSLPATAVVGMAGSLLGGLVYNLAVGNPDVLAPSGLLGSILGAAALVLLVRTTQRRSRG